MTVGNFGCGTQLMQNAENYDKHPIKKVVDQLDMDVFPYPFPTNHFSSLVCRHTIEHLNSNPYDVMKELHRVTQQDGDVIIELPIFGNLVSHQRFLHSRNYMNPICARVSTKDHNYISNLFEVTHFKKTQRCSIKKIMWKLKTRFLTWVDSFLYDGYEWTLKVKK